MLYFYYGAECAHCHDVMPIVDKLIGDGIKIVKLETWHNEENAEKYQSFDDGKCGGVPFFINTESGEWICGAADEDRIREWAVSKKKTE